jgi:hypothetical protein
VLRYGRLETNMFGVLHMPKAFRLLAAVFGLCSLLVGRALAEAAPANDAVLREARAILANLQSSHYSHKTEVNSADGSYAVDCSGLVRLILKKAAPGSLAQVPAEPRYPQPRAVAFYQAFVDAPESAENPGWQRIRTLVDCRPGDLVAWRKAVIPEKGASGHVLILLEKPVLESGGLYRVKVMDSTSTPHANDWRSEGLTGVGVGTIWFSVNASGEPTGVRWSDQKKSIHFQVGIGRALR